MKSLSRRSLLTGTAGIMAAGRVLGQTARTPPVSFGRFDRTRFVEDIKRAAQDADRQRAVESVLAAAVSDPAAVIAGLGDPATPGIHPLHRDPELTILNVIWAPLMVLLPHNHNMWASIGIYTGREDNILWQRRGERIEAVGASALSAKDVFGLTSDAIHSVINPIGRLTGAIHIYGGDFFAPGRSEWDASTLREQPWDLAAAREEFSRAAARFGAVP